MANIEALYLQALTDLDTETNRIAGALDTMRAELATIREAGGMSQAVEAQLATRLQTAIDRLKPLGKVPAPIEEPAPAVVIPPVETPKPEEPKPEPVGEPVAEKAKAAQAPPPAKKK